jgi:hypothetical protein
LPIARSCKEASGRLRIRGATYVGAQPAGERDFIDGSCCCEPENSLRRIFFRSRNSRNTEAHLNDVLQRNSGQTKDVLEVERESARVRGEIEQMEAERKSLEHHVEFAAINLSLMEEYRAQIAIPETSVGTRLHNAFVAGLRNASETLLGIVLFTAEYGLTLLLWLVLLVLPVYFGWRRFRRAVATA